MVLDGAGIADILTEFNKARLGSKPHVYYLYPWSQALLIYESLADLAWMDEVRARLRQN